MAEKGRLGKLLASLKSLPRNIKEGLLAYKRSYSQGVEKFGVWWKVFQWSMWLFILVFLGTAVIAFVYFLPKMEIIRYI